MNVEFIFWLGVCVYIPIWTHGGVLWESEVNNGCFSPLLSTYVWRQGSSLNPAGPEVPSASHVLGLQVSCHTHTAFFFFFCRPWGFKYWHSALHTSAFSSLLFSWSCPPALLRVDKEVRTHSDFSSGSCRQTLVPRQY